MGPEEETGGSVPMDSAGFGVDGLEDVAEIGRGGFGVVYRGREPALNRVVAVKFLAATLDATSRARFAREGRAMGTLAGHPNIVNVHRVGVTPAGVPYIVMGFHANGSLAGRLDRDGPLPWREVTRIGVKLAGALGTAHRSGTLHRDVKPENVLLSDYGEPVLADFGIARIHGDATTTNRGVTASVVHAGPEILDGHAATPASDVYSLGSTLFTLLAGVPAFKWRPDELLVALYLRIASQPIPDLRGRGVPDGLCRAVEAAMAKDRADRPASAADFGEMLRDAERTAGFAPTEMALQIDIASAVENDPAPPRTAATQAHDTNPEPGRGAEAHVAPRSSVVALRGPRRIALAALAALVAVGVVTGLLLTRDTRDGGQTAGGSSTTTVTSSSAAGPADLADPRGLAVDAEGTLYVADTDHHRLRSVASNGAVETVAGTGTSDNAGDGRPASEAMLSDPGSVAIGTGGEVLVASGNTVRRISPEGTISTVAAGEADLGAKTMAVLPDGSILVGKPAQILRVDRAGKVVVFAGTGVSGFGGDRGPATAARFNAIEQLAVDAEGNVLVADGGNNRIRRIEADGTVTTVAGSGETKTTPDGLGALDTALVTPTGVAVDAANTLFVAEGGNHRVRRIPLDGPVTTIAGDPDGYSDGFSGDGGPAVDATFGLLGNLAVDRKGNTFILDVSNDRVRRVSSEGNVTTVA